MIVYTISASKANVLDSCWELYNLQYNRRWEANGKDAPLEKGDLIHTMFGHYYREKMKNRWISDESQHGIVLDECTNIARRAAVEMDLEQKEVDLIISAGRRNLLYHMRDGMTVHAVEEPFSKILYEVKDREELQGGKITNVEGIRILFEGRVDLVATLPNQPLSVWDTKSEGRRSNPSELDHQFTGSAWAFGVDTVVVNKVGLQTSVEEKEKFRRVWLDYSSVHLVNEWKLDVIKKVLEAVARHRLELAGTPDWPRNRTSCNKFSGCKFRRVCKAKPSVRNIKLQTWFHVRPVHQLYEEK